MIVFPNAKINIGLRISGRRDDGFHNIETLMVPIKLADALEITPATDGQSGFTLSGIPLGGDIEANLCVKAFRLMQKRYKLPETKIHLHKVIPVGAGLGGGSSDAAFTLKLLNRLYMLKICNQELKDIATELGSDCPFFIENAPSLATGRGELLNIVNLNLKKFSILLVKPQVSVSTAWAYNQVKPDGNKLTKGAKIPSDPTEWNDLLINDFEQPVFKAYPEIAVIKKNLLEMGAMYAAMSGSGSAVFGLFDQLPDLNDRFDGMFVWGDKMT
jgi:4-diphosphocytidyl-2-C-methyl-D-erythritol kinase